MRPQPDGSSTAPGHMRSPAHTLCMASKQQKHSSKQQKNTANNKNTGTTPGCGRGKNPGPSIPSLSGATRCHPAHHTALSEATSDSGCRAIDSVQQHLQEQLPARMEVLPLERGPQPAGMASSGGTRLLLLLIHRQIPKYAAPHSSTTELEHFSHLQVMFVRTHQAAAPEEHRSAPGSATKPT